MRRFQSYRAILCVYLAVIPWACAQGAQGAEGSSKLTSPFRSFFRPYQPKPAAPVSLENSSRLDALTRAGNIYLTLQDAIALALENNLDIAVARYNPLVAGADLMRARSGGLLRGISQSVTAGPASASGAVATISQVLVGASGAGSNLSQLGPAIPSLDPVLTGSFGWAHVTSPQTSLRRAGTYALVTQSSTYSLGYSQSFLTGTSASLSLTNSFVYQNTVLNAINPSRSASLTLRFVQPLLQGLSPAVNNRNIRIARNEVKISNLVFKEQVIATVSNVINLYWDLVSFHQNVDYAKQNLELAQRTYEDNKKQVAVGTLAPIEITRAEAEVASNQQALTLAETQVLQQENILKNALSRNGLMSPVVAEARVVPMDRIEMPPTEPVRPIQDLFEEGLENRPEVEQNRLGVENGKIQLEGTRHELLPSLSLIVQFASHGLAGFVNTVPGPPGLGFPEPNPDPFFLGGNGSALGQLFRRDFPDYRIAFSLNIPFRNRASQSDYVHDQLTLRQSELGYQQQRNQVRVDVQRALVALQQARAQYQAAVKQRILEEQTLDAEQKKFALGTSTTFLVIQAQRDLAQARANEVIAQSQYQHARVNLEVATGRILTAYNININEALNGRVSRQPSTPPAH